MHSSKFYFIENVFWITIIIQSPFNWVGTFNVKAQISSDFQKPEKFESKYFIAPSYKMLHILEFYKIIKFILENS